METQLDIWRHRAGQLRKGATERLLHAWEGWKCRESAIPLDHLEAHVPLDSQISMRNRVAYFSDLAKHAARIGWQDLFNIRSHDESGNDRHRCRQAHLRARFCVKVPTFARRQKIRVGRARFAGIP